MSNQQRLNEQLETLNQQWGKISSDLSRIQESYDNETRVEEQIRLEPIIEDKQKQLADIEKQINSLKINTLINKAQTATKNKAFQKGYDLWQEVLTLAPEHSPAFLQAKKESISLQQVLAQQAQANQLIAQLIERIDEIQPIFSEVVTELK